MKAPDIKTRHPKPPLLSLQRNRCFKSAALPILNATAKAGHTSCALVVPLFPKEAQSDHITATYAGPCFSKFKAGKINPILNSIPSFWQLLAKLL